MCLSYNQKIFTMKTSIFLILAVLFISVTSNAQTPSAKERATALTQSMNCELGLLQKQNDEVQAINLKAAKKMDEIRKSAGDDAALLKKEGAEVDKQRNIELMDVLTYKQWAVYERISSGDQRELKKTAMCRKNPSDL